MHKHKRATFDSKTDGKLNWTGHESNGMECEASSWRSQKIISLTLVLGKSTTQHLFFLFFTNFFFPLRDGRQFCFCVRWDDVEFCIDPPPCLHLLLNYAAVHINTHLDFMAQNRTICSILLVFFLSISLFSDYFLYLWNELNSYSQFHRYHPHTNILPIDIDTQFSLVFDCRKIPRKSSAEVNSKKVQHLAQSEKSNFPWKRFPFSEAFCFN